MDEPEHVNYPHEPGRLYDCPACEAKCHCSADPGTTQCVFEGEHKYAWTCIVFMQGDEADEVFAMLYDIDGVVWSGPYAESIKRTVEHLAQWDMGEESEHTFVDDDAWEFDRAVYEGDYVLTWDRDHLGIGLYRKAERK